MKRSLLVRALCAALCLIVLPACALGEQLTLSFIGDCSIGEAIQNRGKADPHRAAENTVSSPQLRGSPALRLAEKTR